ncbi:hypothetical protein T484DRAFT_1767664 [Baffinella frigidus]|nr:hypothetical protein T484DRAFT_1767664 [Cryptophyta sp. CCMP2293]
MSGESAATLCLLAWCQAGREAQFFVNDWGDGAGADNEANALVEASKRAFRRWGARLTLAVWRATAARATGPGVRVVKNWGSRGNGAVPFPETGVFAPSPLEGATRLPPHLLEGRDMHYAKDRLFAGPTSLVAKVPS